MRKLFGRIRTTKPNKPILVYILQEPIDTVIERTVITSSDGLKAEVIVEKETDTDPGWKFDVTGCLRLGKHGLYCQVIRGAQKAIKYDLENNTLTLSKLTNNELQKIINMKIFKAHYGQLLKDLLSALKPILIGLAIACIASAVCSGVGIYMLSKIPAIAIPIPGG